MMFTIFVKNLKLYGYHGVKQEEKEEGQYFVFNVEIDINKESFEDKDDISETVNYSEAVRIIKGINAKNKFNLLETLAEKIMLEISKMSPMITGVRIVVEKTKPPIKEKLNSVGAACELKVDRTTESNGEDTKKNEDKIVYFSIGTNKGDRIGNIKNALNLIDKSGIFKILQVSSIYETEPMYFKNQENFYNLVVKSLVSSSVSPFVILGYVKNIEYELGRKKQLIKNGPRVIDIDIIDVEGVSIDSDILKVPHPKLAERNFVIIPLSEIAPDFKINGSDILEYINKNTFPDKVTKIISSTEIF